MKNILFLALSIFVLSAFNQPVDKQKIAVNAGKSTFGYALDHPLHSFDAKATEFKCIAVLNNDSKQLEMIGASVPVKNFDSGNSNRDSHMIETVEGLKYPNISFIAQDLTYKGNTVTANGKLTFHGVTKPFSITGEQSMKGSQLTLSGKFDVDMTTFGIKPPSIMGMSTDKEIKVNFEFQFDS